MVSGAIADLTTLRGWLPVVDPGFPVGRSVISPQLAIKVMC